MVSRLCSGGHSVARGTSKAIGHPGISFVIGLRHICCRAVLPCCVALCRLLGPNKTRIRPLVLIHAAGFSVLSAFSVMASAHEGGKTFQLPQARGAYDGVCIYHVNIETKAILGYVSACHML